MAANLKREAGATRNAITRAARLFTILLSVAAATSFASSHDSLQPYTFGVFPHLGIAELEMIYAPMARNFSEVLGRPVALRSKPSYEQFSRQLEAQTYDIAFIQPFDYVVAHDKYGYLPLARRGEPLEGLIVTRSNNTFRSISDLKGKRIGLPPAGSAVSNLVQVALKLSGLRPGRDVAIQYQRTHDSCLQELLIGTIDACGSAAYPVRFFQNKWKVRFRVLAKTPAIPHALFVVHKRVPPAERERLLKTVLAWSTTPEGQILLKKGYLGPFVRANDAEYEIVRSYLRAQ